MSDTNYHKEIAFETDWATVAILRTTPHEDVPEQKAIYLKWKGVVSREDFQATYEKAGEIMIAHKCKNVLINSRELLSIDPLARAWTASRFYPKIIQALGKGCKGAVISPKSFFAGAVSKILVASFKRQDEHFQFQYFEGEEEAILWILGLI
ncbi:hypothetical protein [Hugenholtzia roseola]|uniref:hypothetical protein n=1 Tax=Hugenholtzia roseola TaxID=1002 RepID=UPI0004224658|nr:hypothetical protein [Hugenholtzia roseola]